MSAVKTRESSGPLQIRYRPKSFDEVWGHASQIKALRGQLADPVKRPHTFLYHGGSGIGKTTLARLVAAELGAVGLGIIEIDGANSGKIDDVRALIADMDMMPAQGKIKAVIIDECHAITKAAWQTFLKATEDVPDHAYYFFCTTEISKVPPALVTRATQLQLKPLPAKMLVEYGRELICPIEGINFPDGAIEMIASKSGGSPRQFLNFIDQARHCSTIEEINEVLVVPNDVDESDPIIRIVKLFMEGNRNWTNYKDLIAQVESVSSAKVVMKRYFYRSYVPFSSTHALSRVVLEALDRMPNFPDENDGHADLALCVMRVIDQIK